MKRHFFSILLSICMVLALFPATSQATEEGSGTDVGNTESGLLTEGTYTDESTNVIYELKDGVLTISGGAAKCTNVWKTVFDKSAVREVEIKSPVNGIAEEAFSDCDKIERVTTDDSATELEVGIFKDCTELKSVKLSPNVEAIKKYAFNCCSALESITIPEKTKSIGQFAFYRCKSLKKVYIDSELNVIKENAFGKNGGTQITDVYYAGTAEKWKNDIDKTNNNAGITDAAIHPRHTHSYGDPVTTEPTCVTRGCTTTTCVCGDFQISAFTDVNSGNHKFDNENKEAGGALKSAGTCQSEAEYYYSCSLCGKVENEDSHTFKGDKDVTNHTGGTELWSVKDATCTEYGYTGDTYCKGCDQKLSEGKLIAVAGHDMTKTEAKSATCTEEGNNAYWYCSKCNKYFADEKGTTETTVADQTIPASGHDMTHIGAVAATDKSEGNIEYWYCEDCDKYFADEEGTTEISKEETVIESLPVDSDKAPVIESLPVDSDKAPVIESLPVDSDKAPATGDDFNMAALLALLIVAIGTFAGTGICSRRR